MSPIARQTIYEDDLLRLYWNSTSRAVELEAIRAASSVEFRAGMERILQMVKERGARKVLADTSAVGKLSDDDLLWTVTDWLARLAKAGVRAFAVVPPKSLAAHLSFEKMSSKVAPDASGLTTTYFKDADSAREWLAQQK